MNELELYRIAETENIKIDNFKLKNTVSLALIDDENNCYIAVSDECKMEHLAHELGHCMTGSFYNRYASYDLKAKQEWKAKKWAIKKLVPLNELKKAFSVGIVNVWELAELFNVSESFINSACQYYAENLFIGG